MGARAGHLIIFCFLRPTRVYLPAHVPSPIFYVNSLLWNPLALSSNNIVFIGGRYLQETIMAGFYWFISVHPTPIIRVLWSLSLFSILKYTINFLLLPLLTEPYKHN